jgi:deoxyribonuclease-4
MRNGGYRVGFHVSISGGISNSVDNARGIGCSAFQIFSRNPRGWAAKPLTADDISLFKGKLSASGIDPKATVVHMPYLPNLSGPAGEPYSKSVDTLAGEVGRTGDLGIPYLVIHLGSHMGKGAKSGIDQLANAVNTARDRMKNKVTILLENSAGQKNSIGSQFEEMGTILDRVGDAQVCLDTCHLFAAGHDLRTAESVAKVLDSFDRAVGLAQTLTGTST